MSKKKLTWGIAILAVCLVILTFFVVSLCLAQQHNVSLIAEWKTWFGIKESVKSLSSSAHIARLIK